MTQNQRFLAFVGDRFEVVTRKSYDRNLVPEGTEAAYDNGAPALIYPLPAQNHEENNEFVLNNVQYQVLADRYHPINDYKDEVFTRALMIDRIKPTDPQEIELLATFQQSYNEETDALFILQRTTKDFIVVSIDRNDLVVKDYLPIDPWDILRVSTKLT